MAASPPQPRGDHEGSVNQPPWMQSSQADVHLRHAPAVPRARSRLLWHLILWPCDWQGVALAPMTAVFFHHLLLFQVIDSPEVHMLGGGGGAGGRGPRRVRDWVSLATGGTHLGRWLWRMQHAHLRWGAMPCCVFVTFCASVFSVACRGRLYLYVCAGCQ